MAGQVNVEDRKLLAVIADEDTVTGLLLAGIGHITPQPDPQTNYMIVHPTTPDSEIETAFHEFVSKREDIAIILINQHVASRIRSRVDGHNTVFPAILEIPSKDHPYEPNQDGVLKRLRQLGGGGGAS